LHFLCTGANPAGPAYGGEGGGGGVRLCGGWGAEGTRLGRAARAFWAPWPKPQLPGEAGSSVGKAASLTRGGARPRPPPGGKRVDELARRALLALVNAPQAPLDSGAGGAGVNKGIRAVRGHAPSQHRAFAPVYRRITLQRQREWRAKVSPKTSRAAASSCTPRTTRQSSESA
jgi:hypothetical protein